MLAHNKVQSGNSQDHYQLPPPQQQQRHEHRQFVHQRQLPEHEHGRLGPQFVPEAQAPQKRTCHQEDEHERHYSVGQGPLHHLQHRARPHRQVDLSRPRNRSSTIHPTIANMVSPMSPHRPRSHPYSFAPPPIPTTTATTTPPRASSTYRSFSPASSSSSLSSSSSSRNVSLSPGLESEATMLHHASRGHSASQRGDEMAEVMKQEYDMEELSYDSMMDQCEPQREWSTSSSQHTNSPSPVMCSSAYSVPVQETSPYQQHPSLQKHNRYRRESEEEGQQELKVEKEGDHQLKQEQPFDDQYTHTSLSHEQHPRSSQRHWQPQSWEQHDQRQQHNDRKREYDHGLDGEQQQQRREEHMIQPPSPTSDSWNRLSRRRGSGSTDYSMTVTATAPVLPSSSALSSSAALPLPSLSFSSISLTRRMANLYPPRKQQQSSHTINPVPNSPNNTTSSPPQHSSTSTSSPTTTASSSCLPPLRQSTAAASAGAATTVNSASNNTTHAPSCSLPFALSSSSREKLASSSSGRSLPPPPLHSTATTVASTSSLSSSAAQQYQHTQPPSPTTKRPIDVSEDNVSYEYRSKAQRMLYERHPPSPIDNTNNNGRSASSSPPAPRLSHVSDREHSAPPSPPSPPSPSPPVHATTTLANRASFGSLREYQSDRRQHYHSYQSQQQQSQRQEQQTQHRHQYPQQMSLPLTSSLSQYELENRLPQIGRPQQQQQFNQQHPQSYRHSYPQHGHRSGSTGLGLEQPKLSSLAFSQRQPMESESSASSDRSSNSGSSSSSSSNSGTSGSLSSNSGSSGSSSSNSAACSLVPRLPTPSTIGGDRVHSQIVPAPSSAHQQLQRLQPLPGTEGMTVVKNDEGAIMVYNPATDAMTFRCELCPGESFGRIHDLKRHQASKHQEMTWPCDFCHRPFVRRDALLRHYTVKAARDDGLHPATHEVEKLLAARAKAKMLY